jgi:microcystin-dependent protein
MLKRLLLAFATALGLSGPAPASQYDFGTIVPETTTGTQLASHLNAWRTALNTLHAGSSRPAYAAAGTLWLDTSGSPWLLKVYGGSADVTLGPIDDAVLAGRLRVGSARPTYAATGTLWVNTSSGSPVLTYYNGTTDIAMGPIASQSMGVAPGVEAPFAGPFAPTGWLLEYGQAVSRTTYAALLDAIAPSFACTTTSGNAGVTVGTNFVGTGIVTSKIEGPGIAPGATVTNINDATGLTISAGAGGGFGDGTCRVFPHGNGDGSSTFNVPDRRGRAVAGRDGMGGTDAGRLQVYFGDNLGAAGGDESILLATGQMPSHNHGGAIGSGAAASNGDHNHTFTRYNETLTVDADDGGGSVSSVWRSTTSATGSTTGAHTHTVTGTISSQGGGTATPLMQPTGISNYIIKH